MLETLMVLVHRRILVYNTVYSLTAYWHKRYYWHERYSFWILKRHCTINWNLSPMYWILLVRRRFKTGSKLYKECMSSLAPLLPPRKFSCNFWKPISPWILYSKRQKTYRLLCFTSYFNVCSQFVSSVMPSSSAQIFSYTQRKCKWSVACDSFILVEDNPHARSFLIRGLEEEMISPPQFHRIRRWISGNVLTNIDPFS